MDSAKDELPDLFTLQQQLQDPKTGVIVKDRTKKLRTYTKCFIGREAVDWIANYKNTTREKAVEMGQALVNAGYLAFVIVIEWLRGFPYGVMFAGIFQKLPTNEELAEEVNDKWIDNILQFIELDTTKSTSWTFEQEIVNGGPMLPSAIAYSRAIPGESLRAFKVIAKIRSVPISSLVNLLHTNMIERHSLWNETFVEGGYLQIVDENLNAQYWVFDPKKGMSKREFVVVRRKVELSTGAVALFDKSIEHGYDALPVEYTLLTDNLEARKRPLSKEMVRANLPFNVRHFQSKEDADGPYVELQYVNLTDLGGWLPKALVNKVNAGISLEEIKHIVAACSTELKADRSDI